MSDIGKDKLPLPKNDCTSFHQGLLLASVADGRPQLVAGMAKQGHRGPLIVSEGLRSSLTTSRYAPVAAIGEPRWQLKLNLMLCPILVRGTGDVLGPACSLASTPPPWGC